MPNQYKFAKKNPEDMLNYWRPCHKQFERNH